MEAVCRGKAFEREYDEPSYKDREDHAEQDRADPVTARASDRPRGNGPEHDAHIPPQKAILGRRPGRLSGGRRASCYPGRPKRIILVDRREASRRRMLRSISSDR